MEKDYKALFEASLYDVVQENTDFEPEFIAGTTYTWGEIMQYLIDWNKVKGNEERAQYLQMCLDDKAYYFSDI